MKTHYLPDGKVYSGETHKADGKLMTGKTHTKDSVFLTHTPPTKEKKVGRLVKGSKEAREYMASIRDKKK